MTNITLMAGEGTRFKDAGYLLPKPLIPVDGTMIEEVINHSPSAIESIFDNADRQINKGITSIDEFSDKIDEALKGKFTTEDLVKFISVFKSEIEELSKITEGAFKFSDKEFIQTVGALRVQLQKQISMGVEEGFTQEEHINKQIVASSAKRQKIAEAILKNRLEQLKAQGILNSELLKAESSMKRMLGIHDSFEDKLKRRLDLEKAVNEEKRLQNNLSSESVKLFDIATEHGTEMAKKIREVLSGQRDFNTFVRIGGKEVELFKENFADIFKQQQALAFFKGTTVAEMPKLRGGFGVPIQEEALRRPVLSYEPRIAMNIIVNAETKTQIAKLVEDTIKKEAPRVGSTINKALAETVLGEKGTTF